MNKTDTGKKSFYVTTPIYYVNAKPHLGTLYTTVIADVIKRWNRLRYHDVLFMTGTDEHGQKIQERAAQDGIEAKAFCDSMIHHFESMWKKYHIEYDVFTRTTSSQHKETVVHNIKKLEQQGDIYKAHYTGWYCVPCETFISISHDSIKNEQGEYLCTSCKRVVRELSEESYFFRLSAYQDALLKFYQDHPDFIAPKERLNEVVAFVKSGLKDLSISRTTINWGIQFPSDPKHVLYVWIEALQSYLSTVGCGQEGISTHEMCARWWPAQAQVMGKDIVRFHAVYWPAMLMALGLAIPKKLIVHGFILMGENKMSKSLGNAIDPENLATWYGVEPVRYYLMRQMSIAQDSQFSLQDLEERIAADLANNLGNLLNRTLVLALNNNLAQVKPPEALELATTALRTKCIEMFHAYAEAMDHYQFNVALSELWRFVADVNAFFHAQQPWTLAKTNKELFAEVIWATCESLHTIAVLAWPVMPEKMQEALTSLGKHINFDCDYDAQFRTHVWTNSFSLIARTEPLFVRAVAPEEAMPKQPDASTQVSVAQVQATPEITIDDFAKVDLRVGTVLLAERVSGSEKLLRLDVDFGELGKRQILSGIAQYTAPEELINKQCIFVVNLAPRTMMGMQSHGMLLAVNDAQNLRIATITGPIANGLRVK